MTTQEFKAETKRLIEIFPQHFSSQTRVQLIFERVKDLDIGWFRKCVDRMIITNDPRFNFDDAARGERLARKQVELTNDIIRAQEALAENISNQGLEKALAEVGASSLTDILRFKPTGG